MTPFRILQGQDATFLVTVKLNGVAVDLSTYDGYTIVVCDSAKKIIARFSKNPVTGYDSIDATDEASGNIQFHLTNEVTKQLANVQLYWVMLTEQPFGGDAYFSGTQTAQELVFVERSPLPLIPDLS